VTGRHDNLDDSEKTVPDSRSPRGSTAVTWLVTLLILGFMVYMSVSRAMVEDEKPVHHSKESPSPSAAVP
jgi:hypothetical protein